MRGKNKKEYLGGIVRHFGQTTDEYVLSFTQKDVDEFFDKERTFIFQYFNLLKEGTTKADRMTAVHKNVADSIIRIYLDIIQLATIDHNELEKFLTRFAEGLEKVRVSRHVILA